MAVLRVNKTKDYTIMSNYHLKEKEMSLKAKGLLSLMLSLPDDWDYSIKGLVAICKENETAIISTLKELKYFGYLKVNKILPNKQNKGKIEYVYDIYEKPIKQDLENQGIENQDLENLGVENLGLENQDLENLGVENLGLENQGIENQVQLNTNKLNTNKLSIKELKTKEEKYCAAKAEPRIPYQEIVEYLNQKTGSFYKYTTSKTKNLIKARFNDGFTLDDFKKVIDNKCDEWVNNSEMNKYLRPETLFGNKFESYLNQKIIINDKKNNLSNQRKILEGIFNGTIKID